MEGFVEKLRSGDTQQSVSSEAWLSRLSGPRARSWRLFI